MSGYTSPNQIRPVQLPDIAGITNAMSSQSLNAMREEQLLQQSQQLRGAETEKANLRVLFSRPGFDPMAPGSAREILLAAPTTGAATFNALSGAHREQRQAQSADLENEAKLFDLSRRGLVGLAALPEGERQSAWTAWRAQTMQRLPYARNIPAAYSPEAYSEMISTADQLAQRYNQGLSVFQGPGNVPGLIDSRSGRYQMGTEVPAGGAPGPRAEAPGLTPAQQHAAHLLRGFEDYKAAPYFDRTAHRAGYGSDTTTLADGSVVPVRQGTTVSREDAERDLARRIATEFTPRAENTIGKENFAALPANAQAALISIVYNYGHIPPSLLPAARSGDLTALSQAVAALPANPGRRQSEAAVIAGQGPRVAPAPGASAPTNAMAPPRTAPGNAMLVSQDALASDPPLAEPNFTQRPAPRTLNEAELNKALLDVQKTQAIARATAQVQRETATDRVVEAGQLTAEQTRAKLEAEEAVKRRQDAERLDTAIREVEKIMRPGGLLQRATGSGAGSVRDTVGNFVGMSSRAAEAARALPPITDLALKMVPRFEGPQSERDVKVYENAAGDLSNPTIPNAQRLAAGREILRLMRDRRGQFSYDESRGGAPASPAPAAPSAPAAAGFTEGQTATGPNGQRIVFRGGQWAPMQ